MFTTLDTIGKELDLKSEPEEHQDQDHRHIAEPGKPPHHHYAILLFTKHVLLSKQNNACFTSSVALCHPKTILQNIVWPKLSTRIL